MRKKKEQDLKRKADLEAKKKQEEEAKKKEAEIQRQKQEKLKQQREKEAALRAQRERDAVNSTSSKPASEDVSIISDKEADDEADREAARFSKMFGVAPNSLSKTAASEPPKKGVDALIQKEREHDQILRAHDQKQAEDAKAHESDWRKQEDEFLNKVETTEDEAEREAARMAKMFGLSPSKLTVPSPKTSSRSSQNSTASSLSNEESDDATAAKEAERMARMMGGNAKNYDPKEEQRERERKKFEQSLQGINDPKELSKAFLNDPSMLAHLKDVKGVIAVNTLKGVDVPGHQF